MNNNFLSSKLSKVTLEEKDQKLTNPFNIDLSLISDKQSMNALVTLAKKTKSGIIKRDKEASDEVAPNNTTNTKPSITINIKLNHLNQPNEENKNQSEPEYLGEARIGPLSSSANMQKRLGIIQELNSNVTCQAIAKQLDQIKDSPEKCFNTQRKRNEDYIHGYLAIANDNRHNSGPIKKNTAELESKEHVYCDNRYSVKNSLSVMEFSYNEDQNTPYKVSMEDKGIAIDCFNNNKDESLFCLFDGHGGSSVSAYLQENYPFVFKNALNETHGNIEKALKLSFKNIDLELQSLNLVRVGSTGCVVHIKKENDIQVVYIANIGDTSCSLITPNEYIPLTYEHRASDPDEMTRIINSGGYIINNRVMGQLMLSRAFGDFYLKSLGVKSNPHITKITINQFEKNQYLIIATDGVWDIIDENDIQSYIRLQSNTEEICKNVIKNSLSKGSWDNISCYLVKLT